jgi:hypothetical protein
MKGSYEVLNSHQSFFWSFHCYQEQGKWTTRTETIQDENDWLGEIGIPAFSDDSEALLLNTIQRWCIINNCEIRPALTLTMSNIKYQDCYLINDERVFLCFKWMVQARFKRRKSGRVRIHSFEVHSQDREGATDSASRNFKGATMLELLSLTPCGFGYCYWKDRPGFPNIDPDIISRLQMPENL